MCSMYVIRRHDDLILELASRWCSRTNTFDFPWGEATLTLEDMSVLGGFSALGVSALHTLDGDAESLKIVDQLELARKELIRSKTRNATPGKWMEKFMGCGSDLEHAGFLSLWLSRFVFPCAACNSIINQHVFPIAVRLSRGIKIALGSAVLLMLYKDLTALSKRLRFTQLVVVQLNLFALFHLGQVWAWERFPMLKPVPNWMYSDEDYPRLARWSNVKIPKDKDLRSAIAFGEKAFLWCPYGVFSKRGGKELLKTSELSGFDSTIERYHPQRVAKQFGLDQEIPKVKVENAMDCCPPRFPRRIEVIDVADSDDSDSNGAGRSSPCAIASPDVAIEETYSKEKHQTSSLTGAQINGLDGLDGVVNLVDSDSDDDCSLEIDVATEGICSADKTKQSEGAQIKNDGGTNVVSSPSNHESNEEMESVHGTSKAAEGRSCDAESYMNERSEDLDFEARISRLENIVYAHIKALVEARK